MKKLILIVTLTTLSVLQGFGQVYLHPTVGLQNTYVGNCEVNTCSGTYYDNGGAGSNYALNIGYPAPGSIYRTFCPNVAGNCVRITFNSFSVEPAGFFGCYDYITIRNGPTQNSPILFQGCGTSIAAGTSFTASNASGCLTVAFYSDNTITAPGWSATISCVPCGIGPAANTNADCQFASYVCDGGSTITANSAGPGLVSDACVSGCALTENYSNWYIVNVTAGGNLGLVIDPNPNTVDYDFAFYGPVVGGCGSLGAPIRCSYAANTNNTGMATGYPDNSEDVLGDGWVNSVNVVPGIYYLMVNQWSYSPGSLFSLDFTGTATIGLPAPSPVSYTPVTCSNQTLQLFGPTIPGATYNWSGPGGWTSSLEDPTRTPVVAGTYTLTYTSNGCNSPGTSVIVTIPPDVTPPTITCPANQTVNLNASCQVTLANYTGSAVTGDNCGVASVTQSPVAGTVLSGTGVQVVTLTVTDLSGNTASCNFNVTKNDITPPTITCPAAQTLALNASCQASLPNYTGLATTSDNCSAVTVTQSPVAGTIVSGTGSTTVTLTATDASGNTSSCNFTVNKVDNTAPTITCPAAQTLALNASCQASLPSYTGLATTSDNCSAVTVTQSPVAGTIVSGTGSATITLTATDANGNTSSCTFTVNKVDNIAPTITCPAAQTLALNASCQASLPSYTGLATTSDNCSAVTVTQSPVAGTIVSGIGSTTITLTATDASGNTSSCTFTVNKVDNIAPTITCPAAQTLVLNASCQASLPSYTGLATTSDNCSAVTVTQSPVAGTIVSGTGSATITLTATDANGNTSSCTFTVNKVDNIAPTITCPAAQTLALDASCQAALPNYTGLATTSDNCSAVTVTQSPVAGTIVSGTGSATITLTATDASGNTSSCTFTVNKVDNIAPTVTCPGNQTTAADANCQFAIADYTALVTSSDNCSAVTITQSPVAGTLLSGTQTVTMTGTDANGNSATCTFQVTVIDNTPPTITCPAAQTGNVGASCQFALLDYTSMATAADNCTANPAITQSPVAGTNVGLGTTVVTLTATDANGNSATCTFNVVVTDVTPPVATCPAAQTLNLDASCNGTLADYTSLVTATDNCAVASVTQSPIAGTAVSGVGTTAITITVTDVNGNSSTCSFDVNAVDVTAPTVTCPGNQTATADVNCQFTMADYTGMVTSSDNCSAVTVTQSPAAGTLVSGTQTVTMTGTDANGNSSTCTFQVTVVDNTNPVISSGCPSNQTANADATCGYTLPDFSASLVVTDNCTPSGSITYTQSPVSGTIITLGVTTVTVTASDANGNSVDCIFDVTVVDVTAPTFVTCPSNQNLTIVANCDAALPDFTSAASATDNCSAAGSITITQSPVAGTVISGNGTVQTVTLTATDADGNSATCTFDVTLVDGVAPTFVSCTPDQNESPDVNCQFTLTDYTSLATVTDNCVTSTITVTQSPVAGTVITGTTLITLTATDQDGNSSTCTFNVILQDAAAPTITSGCPANQTVNADASCGFSLTDFTGTLTVTDNCSNSASITITQSPVAGTVLALGTTTVTLTATDLNGNDTTCTFDVTVVDVTPPAITCPGNIMSCDPVVTYIAPVGTDNCSGATTAQTDVTGLSSGSTFPIGTTTLTYTVTDGSGNSTSCSFDVTVVDVTTTPNAGADVSYCDGDIIMPLNGTAATGGTLTWYDDPSLTNVIGTGPSITPSNLIGSTSYYLSEDVSGCNSNPDVVVVTITVCDTLELIIPTGFTPADGDGVNDVWEIVALNSKYPANTVQVYGRWGGLVFESQGYDTPWDGTNNGKTLPVGSYYFVIDLGDGSNPIKGTVTIIK